MKPHWVAEVHLWGQQVGAIAWDAGRQLGFFEYQPQFLRSGLPVAPLTMPLSNGRQIFSFPQLPTATFYGLPAMIADALPDRFGHQVFDAWLTQQGRTPEQANPIERLLYIGQRGMGALTFQPAQDKARSRLERVAVDELVTIAQSVLTARYEFAADADQDTHALAQLLKVGTSAGGARPKAVIAINRGGLIRSGQVDLSPDYTHWIMKLDGVAAAGESGYGRVEYAYYLMATAAGIDMAPCKLYAEHDRAHFMTQRFDRVAGQRLHMQSLCALTHNDYRQPGVASYESVLTLMRRLRCPRHDAEQWYRRACFNVLARNQDDHTKNVAFLMDSQGRWRLSPAFDLCWAYRPDSFWVGQHQMTINDKRDGFESDDLIRLGRQIRSLNAEVILTEVAEAVSAWPEHAEHAGVPASWRDRIQRSHRVLSIAGCTL